jgi:hypothetical protein
MSEQEEDKKTTEEDKAKKEAEDKAKWDEARQKIDQAESVANKARQEAMAFADAYEESKAEIKQLKEKLEIQEKATQEKKDELVTMNPEDVDKSVVANIQRMEARDKKQAKRIEQLELKAKAYEEAEEKRRSKATNQELQDEVLATCDKEFGAKYRSEAIKMADELVDSGKEKQPTTQFTGYTLMRKCYQAVVKKAEESKKDKTSDVPTDSGSSGISHKTSRKAGSRAEVLADMRKDRSWQQD